MKYRFSLFLLVALSFTFTGCAAFSEPTPTPTRRPTITPLPTKTQLPSLFEILKFNDTATPLPTPTTEAPSQTPFPTDDISIPTETALPSVTIQASPTKRVTATTIASATRRPTQTASKVPTQRPTSTTAASATTRPTQTASKTSTARPTSTTAASATTRPTSTLTLSPVASPTRQNTATAKAVIPAIATRPLPSATSTRQPQPTATRVPPTATKTATLAPATSTPTLAGPTATRPATTTPVNPLATLTTDEWQKLPIVPSLISERMRKIYREGLAAGRDPNRFSKIGDCQNVDSYFLSIYDKPGEYSLGQYTSLKPTIDHYSGSWSRKSLAVKGGMNVASVLTPAWADRASCNKGETPLACEIRVNNPSVIIISMETWWGKKPAETYENYMRKVIESALDARVVPILATKADNLEGHHQINAVIAKLAREYELPLWNFWSAVQPLPYHGLTADGFHLTFARNFFDDPIRMESAWPWRNLTALQTIDSVLNGLTIP